MVDPHPYEVPDTTIGTYCINLCITVCVIIDMHYGICKYYALPYALPCASSSLGICKYSMHYHQYASRVHHHQRAQRYLLPVFLYALPCASSSICATVSASILHLTQSHPFLYSRTIFYTLCYITTMSNKYTITYLLMSQSMIYIQS